ncbi:beta-galactosidase [candidate division KSB1 bacterium]|nr:beta-galactosidase [candidate division KSB1 bacterium]
MLQKRLLALVILLFVVSSLFSQELPIYIFKDPAFKAHKTYHADDVARLLKEKNRSFKIIDHQALETLSRDQTQLLILPYIQGNFSEKALERLVSFHENGGGILILGDHPNKDKWYPLRNMQSSLLHLTRSGEGMKVEGLTLKGKEIFDDLPDLEYFKEKNVVGVKTTAYPPDKTYDLLQNNSTSSAEPIVVAVERKGKFLGSRFGIIGANGGEPRENVDGAYQMEWTYNPGILTRDWKGIDTVVWRFSQWILNRPDIAGHIDLIPVHREGTGKKITLRIRNLSDQQILLKNLDLFESRQNKLVYSKNDVIIPARQILEVASIDAAQSFGSYKYILSAKLNEQAIQLDQVEEFVFPKEASDSRGFGFSMYWAFQEPQVSESYKYFVKEMMKKGSQYVRANIPWEDVEPEPGQYDWRIPADMLKFAEQENLKVFFWMFATTRGSGLGDGGVPWWSLKEPAIDRDGNKGFHPTLWSPFYRQHYFGMIDGFTKEFANAPALDRFVLDFGNSDFPYGYNYYVNPPHLFDYSDYEREAFAKYLRQDMDYDLAKTSRLYDKEFTSWDDVPVPLVEEQEPWRIYLNFRRWSVQNGMENVAEICTRNAPDKVASDPPGHGLGSISDLSASWYDVKKRHWNEEQKYDKKYTRLHNAGPEWGGEPWQVGGTYKEYDDALFGSLRYNSNYFSIPAPDIACDADGIARIGFIRRTIMGASQTPAEIAVIDKTSWNVFQSNCQVAVRMDQGVDLLCSQHRFDFSCYKLLALPNDELQSSVGTVTTKGSLLPMDEHWYWLIRESVEKGLTIVVYPKTCLIGRTPVQMTFLRQVMALEDVRYGERKTRTVEYPAAFGGGISTGQAVSIDAEGEVLLRDETGEPVLVKRPFGKGAILLAGWDDEEDSFNGRRNYFEQDRIGDHTLVRIAEYMGLTSKEIKSDHLNIYKSLVHQGDKDYFLVYSHLKNPVEKSFYIKLQQPSRSAFDLATDEVIPVEDAGDGWYKINLKIESRKGRYLSFHD